MTSTTQTFQRRYFSMGGEAFDVEEKLILFRGSDIELRSILLKAGREAVDRSVLEFREYGVTKFANYERFGCFGMTWTPVTVRAS